MKEDGFTLIELLAVIVILAIIAIIAVPIVLGIIEDTKSSATQRTAELYLNTAEIAITKKNLNTQLYDATCNVKSDGNLDCDGILIEIDMKDKQSIKNGTLVLKNGKIISVIGLEVDGRTYKLDLKGKLVESKAPCMYTGTLKVGTEVVCGIETFNVLETSNGNVRMLASRNITLSDTKPVQTDEFTPAYFSD